MDIQTAAEMMDRWVDFSDRLKKIIPGHNKFLYCLTNTENGAITSAIEK